MKVSPAAVKEVEQALKVYEQEVDASGLSISAKNTYLLHARQFVRWLKGEFVPGAKKRG